MLAKKGAKQIFAGLQMTCGIFICTAGWVNQAASAKKKIVQPPKAVSKSQANKPSLPEGYTNGIAVVVGSHIISTHDVYQRMRYVMRSSNIEDNPGNRCRLKPLITQALVDEEIELQQAASGANITPEKIQMAIKNLEKRNRMAPGDINFFANLWYSSCCSLKTNPCKLGLGAVHRAKICVFYSHF